MSKKNKMTLNESVSRSKAIRGPMSMNWFERVIEEVRAKVEAKPWWKISAKVRRELEKLK